MSFHDVELPEGVRFGSLAGAGFATHIHETGSGHEWRVARTAQGRHRFAPIKSLLDKASAKALKAFGLARRGSLHSWPLKDWSDYTTNADGETAPTATDAVLGTGDGSNKNFQLLKTYLPGDPGEYPRTLTLPRTGTVLVAVNGTPTGAFTVNGTGVVTLTSAPSGGQVVTAGCEFRVPVRFEKSVDDWLRLQADAYDRWTMQDLACIEVKDEVQYPERWFAGGMRNWGTMTSDFLVAFNDGQLQLVKANAAINLFLPPATYHPGGDVVFTIANDATASSTVQVRDDAGNAVGSAIAAGGVKMLALARTSSTYQWVMH